MRRRTLLIGSAASLVLSACVTADRSDRLPPLSIRQFIAAVGGHLRNAVPQLWPGAPEAPFLVLLVGADYEYLFNRDSIPDGFENVGTDRVTGSPIHRRPRQFEPGLLATFPAIEGISTIVIGYPEATDQSDPADWMLTLMHEHFHQRQAGASDYYARTAALDLSGGDETGMWMLNYVFPYDRADVAMAIDAAGAALRLAVDGSESEVRSFVATRSRLRGLLSAGDWRYLTFQVWQEGVARFAEIDLGLRSERADWQAAAQAKRVRVLSDLDAIDLADRQRVAFYSYGAAEAMLLDRIRPQWRAEYFAGSLSLDRFFDAF